MHQPPRDDHGDDRRRRLEARLRAPLHREARDQRGPQDLGRPSPLRRGLAHRADEATLLTTEKPIEIGGYPLAAGTYSLFTVPAEEGTAKLIINKKTGQWGVPYKVDEEKANELARVEPKKTVLDKPVNQFTMAIESQPGGGGELKMMWEKTQYSIPFTVKK